jgi:hypothetical protein
MQPETQTVNLRYTEISPDYFLALPSLDADAMERAISLLRFVFRELRQSGEGWYPFSRESDDGSTLAIADLVTTGLMRIAVAKHGGKEYACVRPSELAGRLFAADTGE